jgi:antitoxin component HigA of HigAB toxin-antitoxin module
MKTPKPIQRKPIIPPRRTPIAPSVRVAPSTPKAAPAPAARPEPKKPTPVSKSSPPPAAPVNQTPKRSDSDHPKLYNLMSLIGFLLAGLRAQDPGTLMTAENYIPGAMNDLGKYGIDFPGLEYGEIQHYVVMKKWPQAFIQLKNFSDKFGPKLRAQIEVDNSVKAEIVTLAKTFLAMIAVRDPNRWGRHESAAVNKFKYLDNPALNSVWRSNVDATQEDQEDEMAELAEIVKQFKGAVTGDTPREKYTLSYSEREKLRKDDPELNQRYNKAYNSAIKKYRAVLRNYILDHGDKPQPIAATREYMESHGFFLNDLPKELDRLLIGSDGFYRTDAGLKVIQRPQPGAIIGDFNPDYDPEDDNSYIFKYRTDDGKWAHAYTEKFKRTSKTLKSEGDGEQAGMLELIETIPPKRPIWLKDFTSKDTRRRLCAVLTDISYLACTRIGSPAGYTKGVGTTYGLSTLLRQHVKLTPANMTFHYKGKDGKDQTHVFRVSNKDENRIITQVKPLLAGKKDDDRLFTDDDDKPITNIDVNKYMKGIGLGITSHYMRSIRGTRLMRDILAKHKTSDLQKMSPQDVEKLFYKEALEVGSLLGHVSGGKTTAITAVNNYIDPTFAQHWFNDKGLRVPLRLKTAAKNLD